MRARTTVTNSCSTQLEVADARISQLFHELVGHGFFKFEISGSVVKGGKRIVVVTAGKDYKYTIPIEDIPEEFLLKGGS